MNKSLIAIYVFIFLSIGVLFPQAYMDINDDLYSYINLWYGEGLIKRLPNIRPYSPKLVKEILEKVKQRGGREDSETADWYLKKIGKTFRNDLSLTAETNITGDKYSSIYRTIYSFALPLSSSVSAAMKIGGNLIDRENGEVFPAGERRVYDFIEDDASINLNGKTIDARQGIKTLFSVETGKIRFQSGVIRSAFGPFFNDGAVVSNEAPMAGHFSFLWDLSAVRYYAMLLSLTASTNTGYGRFPEKYFFLHGLRFFLFPWMDMNLFESVVWGKRIDLLYLMPMSILFDDQGLGGFEDNSFLGFSINFNINKIKIPLVFYADDLHFRDLAAFKFDTRYKFSFETGISWAPDISFFKLISVNYLMVTPYMYTHKSAEGTPGSADYGNYINYQNYTHLGTNLGPGIEPNSDRLRLNILLMPLKFFKVNMFSSLVRHGNASEGYSSGDGSIFDDGWVSSTENIFSHLRFLTQNSINYIWQLGTDIKYLNLPIFEFLNINFKTGFVWQVSFSTGESGIENKYFINMGFSLNF